MSCIFTVICPLMTVIGQRRSSTWPFGNTADREGVKNDNHEIECLKPKVVEPHQTVKM